MIVICSFKTCRQLLNRITQVCNNIINSLVIADVLERFPALMGYKGHFFAVLVGLQLFQAWH